MTYQTIVLTKEKNIASITLNRPNVHNAIDDVLIKEFTHVLDELAHDNKIRVVLLTGNGKSFSAGADIQWMQRTAGYNEADNLSDANKLAELMQKLYSLNKPTIALINGAAIGGGVGLAACCDIAIAIESAKFCLSEVKIGLIPSVISPFVIAAIGKRQAQRYFLTAETFDAKQAQQMQLIHHICTSENLIDEGLHFANLLLNNGPLAVAAAKKLIQDMAYQTINSDLMAQTAKIIAQLRTSSEGREGIQAFLNKRDPNWAQS